MILFEILNFVDGIALLFLTRYGLVIVWISSMYYKGFRSRVMFEKTLWKKVLCFNNDLICNKMLNQKKFYPNPNQVSKIYYTADTLYKIFTKPIFTNKMNSNEFFFNYKFEDKKIPHLQEIISIFDVDHNQEEYSINYEIQSDVINVKSNIEIEINLDINIINKSNIIIEQIERNNLLSEEYKDLSIKEFKKFKNLDDNVMQYKHTTGYIKNNLTTSLKNNSVKIHEITNNKNLFFYTKSGIVKINRNDKDFIRSVSDMIINYKDNNLQNYYLSEEKHQNMCTEVLKSIGGFENIKYHNDIKTKEQMVKILICSWLYLKKNEKW